MTPLLRAALTEYTGSLQRLRSSLVTAERLARALGRELSADHTGALAQMERGVGELMGDVER